MTNELMPVEMNDKLALADTLAKSGLVPSALKTKEQVFVSLQWGHELGLSPMVAVNNIAVINGKPTLGADIQYALVRAHSEYAGIKWLRQDAEVAECEVSRNNGKFTETFRGYFDMKMAAAAGLNGKDNWKKYPARMLKHRAQSFALRDAFPDVLAGVYTPEEMTEVEPRNITAEATAKVDPVKTVSEVFQGEVVSEKKMSRKELVQMLSGYMNAQKPDGTPWFTDAEKAPYREAVNDTSVNLEQIVEDAFNKLTDKQIAYELTGGSN